MRCRQTEPAPEPAVGFAWLVHRGVALRGGRRRYARSHRMLLTDVARRVVDRNVARQILTVNVR